MKIILCIESYLSKKGFLFWKLRFVCPRTRSFSPFFYCNALPVINMNIGPLRFLRYIF